MRCAPHAHDKRQVLQILMDVLQDSITYSSSSNGRGSSSTSSGSTGRGKPAAASALAAAFTSYGTTLPLLGALVTASKVVAAEEKWYLQDLALMLQQLLILAALMFEIVGQLLGALGRGEAAGWEEAGALVKEQQQQQEEETGQQCAKSSQQLTSVCRQEQVEGLLWAGLLSVSTALGVLVKFAHVAGVGAQQRAGVVLVCGDQELGNPLLAATRAETTAAKAATGISGECQQGTYAAAAAEVGPVVASAAAGSSHAGRPSGAQAEERPSSMRIKGTSLSEGPRGIDRWETPGITAGTAGAAGNGGPAAPAAATAATPAAAAPLATPPPAAAAAEAPPAAAADLLSTPTAGHCTCHCDCPCRASMAEVRPAVAGLMDLVKAGGVCCCNRWDECWDAVRFLSAPGWAAVPA